MKHLLLLFVLSVANLATAKDQAGTFRWTHDVGCTGLCNVVCDARGRETTVKFSKDSDAEALCLLEALLGKRRYGSRRPETVHGVAGYDQRVMLTGEFVSESLDQALLLPMAPGWYRQFRLDGLKVGFPFYEVVESPGADLVDGPFFIQVHLGFKTLFPQGVKMDGVPLKLDRFLLDQKPESE